MKSTHISVDVIDTGWGASSDIWHLLLPNSGQRPSHLFSGRIRVKVPTHLHTQKYTQTRLTHTHTHLFE